MLGKLIKHELRATGRTMLPILIVLPMLAMLAGFSMRQLEYGNVEENALLEIILVLIFVAFFVGLVAACAMTFWMMINRFYSNLLGEEGYLMFTLPVSVHSHIWSKLIVSVLWFAVVFVVIFLLAFVLVLSITMSLSQFLEGMPSFEEVMYALRAAFGYNNGQLILFVVEFILLILVESLVVCLQFYSAMAIGHSFANHKVLNSVIAYFAISFGLSVVQTVTGVVYSEFALYGTTVGEFMKYIMHPSLAYGLVQFAGLYLITYFCLKKKLNLA